MTVGLDGLMTAFLKACHWWTGMVAFHGEDARRFGRSEIRVYRPGRANGLAPEPAAGWNR
jgi:hypothetical protein